MINVSDIFYSENLEFVASELMDIYEEVYNATENYKKSLQKFNNNYNGYLGKAKNNTDLLNEAVVAQMEKLAFFYMVTAMNVENAYELMKKLDRSIANGIRMY